MNLFHESKKILEEVSQKVKDLLEKKKDIEEDMQKAKTGSDRREALKRFEEVKDDISKAEKEVI